MKKKYWGITLSLLLVLALSLNGCQSTAVLTESQEDAIEKLVAMMDEQAILERLEWLSKEDSGRMAGTEGEDETVAYLQEQLTAMGYNVEVQPFPFLDYELSTLSLSLGGVDGLPEGKVPSEDVHGLDYSGNTPPEGLKGELVDVGLGSEAEFSGKDVKGKFVLIQRGGEYFFIKAQRAHNLGALGAVFYDPNGNEPVIATLVEPQQIPGISVSTALGAQMTQLLAEGKVVEVGLKLEGEFIEAVSENVQVTLEAPGDIDKRLVLGAHYDGVDTPAANDNGSGVVALMEVAKIAMANKDQLTADLSFVFFGAEEAGLFGSSNYLESSSSEDVNSIVGMINMDMVGIGSELQMCTINGQDQLPLAKGAVKVAEMLDFPVVSMEMGRSDHVPFAESGIPSIMLAAGPVDNYHTDADTVAAIDMKMMLTQIEWVLRILHHPGALDESSEAVFN